MAATAKYIEGIAQRPYILQTVSYLVLKLQPYSLDIANSHCDQVPTALGHNCFAPLG